MNLASIYDLSIKLVDFFEISHYAGYVHNDIALDTINFGQGEYLNIKVMEEKKESCFSGKTINVTDFSFMTPYVDSETGKNLKQVKVDGAIRLSNECQSTNRFYQLRTGPRDDLEMLCNFVFWLTNYQQLLDLKYPPQVIND